MARPTFGLEFIRVNDQPQPVLGANMDVIGIIGPADDADPTEFPLDTPVIVFSNDLVKLDKIGSDGYILDAIDGVNDQLGDFDIAAQIVVVRTARGTAEDPALQLQQTIAKIMGSSIAGTGVHAFKKAPNTLYCTPRLIMAPGYTGQMANSLDTLLTDVNGAGYIPGQDYQVTFDWGAGETNQAQAILPIARATANSDGTITDASMHIDSWGAWMTDEPTAVLPAPDGENTEAVAASGMVIFSLNPAVNSTLTFNGVAVTFVSGTPVGNQVQIGANLNDTIAALIVFLNGSVDAEISKNTYSQSVLSLLINHDTAGTTGNTYTLGSTVTGASLSGPALTGGAEAITPVQATLVATIALGANPVVAELPGVLTTLIAHAVVESAGSSYIGDLNWRNTINHPRIIPLSGGVKVVDADSGDVVVRPFAPRVIGAIIGVDFATGYPFHSAANRPIQGIVAPARTIAFSLMDGDTEGQQLLAANMGILIRGLIGVETAISSGGFIFVGTDNAGDDSLWQFYNQYRGRDYIHLSLMPALRTYLGRANIDRQTVINVIATIDNFLNGLQALQQILGHSTRFQGSLNSAEEIRLGRLTVSFAAEEPPVLRRITTMSARYKPAIDQMVAQLEQQLNFAA